ncbi:MAG: trypsin-like peptidase domain-containing protein, partial [Halobacteria archaeon]|nr:trypsin-like peptidase domain-containing protein [Halobacteria archaeon]
MRKTTIIALVVVTAVISGVAGGYTTATVMLTGAETQGGNSTSRTNERVENLSKNHSIERVSRNNTTVYRRMYKRLMDSVVSIKVLSLEGKSQGTGFVYDSQGHIVTNHHVVEGGEVIEVRFRRGEWRKATLIGKSVYSDLAVLKVDNVPEYVEPLDVAESNPKPGSIVMALG